MEHAKKMVVVPQELIERLQERPQDRPQERRHGGGDSLDAQMNRILNDRGLDDNEKWKEYQRVLQRFLHFAANKRQPIRLPVTDTSEEAATEDDRAQRTSIALVDELVETFPKIYKNDARNLLKTLARRGDLVTWDNDGTVYVNNTEIPGSNIVDILHNIVRVRQTERVPVGWREVMTVLKDINVPSEYINNPAALDFLGYQRTLSSSSRASPRAAMYPTASSTPIAGRTRSRTAAAAAAGPSRPSIVKWEPFSP